LETGRDLIGSYMAVENSMDYVCMYSRRMILLIIQEPLCSRIKRSSGDRQTDDEEIYQINCQATRENPSENNWRQVNLRLVKEKKDDSL